MDERLRRAVMAAMMAAMACIATMIIKVPTPGTNGYVNVGDTVVLISAWLLSNPYGAVAAAIGPALADILSGYIVYAPGTAVIKALMALTAVWLYRSSVKRNIPKIAAYIISSIVAEAVMVAGYLLYESTLLGYGSGAVASVAANIVQGVICATCANILIHILVKIIRPENN